MSYLPILQDQRDAANDYLLGMAARGFGTTVEQAVRQAAPTNPLNWPAPVMEFEAYAAQRGFGRNGYGDAGMHSPAGHVGKANWRAKMKVTADRAASWQEGRDQCRRDYEAAIERGELRAPSRIERLRETASGHPDRLDVQAARRILERYYGDHANGEEAQDQVGEGAP